jgi:uncharacterized protein
MSSATHSSRLIRCVINGLKTTLLADYMGAKSAIMNPTSKKVIAAATVMLSHSAPAFAGPLEDADTAHREGDYATALRLLSPLADQGHPIAQFLLGIMHFKREGVAQDYAEALKWYGPSANQGYAPAQTGFGLMYFNGMGVSRDYTEAMRWFRLAADQGYFLAQFMLGNMYYNGSGIPQDYAEAIQWYSLAANQNYAPAQNNLGVMYVQGQDLAAHPRQPRGSTQS